MSTHVSHEWPGEFNSMAVHSICPLCKGLKEGVKKRGPQGLVQCAECARANGE